MKKYVYIMIGENDVMLTSVMLSCRFIASSLSLSVCNYIGGEGREGGRTVNNRCTHFTTT